MQYPYARSGYTSITYFGSNRYLEYVQKEYAITGCTLIAFYGSNKCLKFLLKAYARTDYIMIGCYGSPYNVSKIKFLCTRTGHALLDYSGSMEKVTKLVICYAIALYIYTSGYGTSSLWSNIQSIQVKTKLWLIVHSLGSVWDISFSP